MEQWVGASQLDEEEDKKMLYTLYKYCGMPDPRHTGWHKSSEMTDSSEIEALAKREKRERLRDRIADEILSTEKSYVDSLETVIEVFIVPLVRKARVSVFGFAWSIV